MRKIYMVKALPFLPAAWLSSLIYAKKTEEESQVRLKKWSRLILKVLGLHLEIQGQDHIPKDRTIYFVCNHQGTLDGLDFGKLSGFCSFYFQKGK